MENMEFYIAAVSDDDGLHWSTVFWWDGEITKREIERLQREAQVSGVPSLSGFTLHGPFTAGAPIVMAA
jgi:hypothetical protein